MVIYKQSVLQLYNNERIIESIMYFFGKGINVSLLNRHANSFELDHSKEPS